MSKPVAVGASGAPARAGPVAIKDVMTTMTTTIEYFVTRECTSIEPRRVNHVNRENRLKVCCELTAPMRILDRSRGCWPKSKSAKFRSRYGNLTMIPVATTANLTRGTVAKCGPSSASRQSPSVVVHRWEIATHPWICYTTSNLPRVQERPSRYVADN